MFETVLNPLEWRLLQNRAEKKQQTLSRMPIFDRIELQLFELYQQEQNRVVWVRCIYLEYIQFPLKLHMKFIDNIVKYWMQMKFIDNVVKYWMHKNILYEICIRFIYIYILWRKKYIYNLLIYRHIYINIRKTEWYSKVV